MIIHMLSYSSITSSMTDALFWLILSVSVVQLLPLQKSLLSLRAISKFIFILQGLITSGLLVIAF